jgi:hypothetical protein
MSWIKFDLKLGAGVQLFEARTPQMQAEVVTAYRHECERCSTCTTIIDPKKDADIKAFCCGRYVVPPQEQMPKRSLLARLFQEAT